MSLEAGGEEIDLLVRPGKRTKGSLNDLVDRHDQIAEFREAAEKAFLERKLNLLDWNISKTADTIDLQRSNLYAKIKRYGIERE